MDETQKNSTPPINPEPVKRSWFDVWHIIAYVIIIAMIDAVYYAVKAYPNEISQNLNPYGQNQITHNTDNSSQVSTADWKTYSNTQYGFGFQYPANYSVVDHSANEQNLDFEIQKASDFNPIYAHVYIAMNTKKQSLDDYFKQYTATWAKNSTDQR